MANNNEKLFPCVFCKTQLPKGDLNRGRLIESIHWSGEVQIKSENIHYCDNCQTCYENEKIFDSQWIEETKKHHL
jgi:hypothetical protein